MFAQLYSLHYVLCLMPPWNINNTYAVITTQDNSRLLKTTPDYSRQLQITQDNSRLLKTTPDYSRQLQITQDNSRLLPKSFNQLS